MITDYTNNVDLLIHDSEFTKGEYATKKRWGHIVYTDALWLALEAEIRSSGCDSS